MPREILFTLRIFGSGQGESILLILEPEGSTPRVFVIDSYATQPYDSPDKNPIIGIQPECFKWDQVEAICLTHAHEDHFMGLESVARRTTDIKWLWPDGIPIDKVVNHYHLLADFKKSQTHPHRDWISGSIKNLAEWSKTQKPFKIISGREIIHDNISIRCIAPTDEISNDYVGKFLDNFGDILKGERKNPRDDFHNIPSAGLIFDIKNGSRMMLLGDMVEKSWEHIFEDAQLMKLLSERKVDVLKLPHHCSNGAIFQELLDLICDPNKTKAVFTPFRLRRPPPHEEAIELVSKYVDELWCTVALPKASENWQRNSDNLRVNISLNNYFSNPKRFSLPPVDCMVAFEVDSSGAVTISHGKYAHCIKGAAYTSGSPI